MLLGKSPLLQDVMLFSPIPGRAGGIGMCLLLLPFLSHLLLTWEVASYRWELWHRRLPMVVIRERTGRL